MKIQFILGSKSDHDFATKITELLNEFNVEYDIKVASAHKVPEKVFEIVSSLNKEDDIVYITIAGRSNGLSGVTAANSVHPVIACPPFKNKDDFSVNINSTLQMPSDTPVITVIDPKNAALAALRILALKNENLKIALLNRIEKIKQSFN
ncbi:5-(carboxyamino)imidazole ribonucleotide mutase [Candidatus Peregrinibacteria bacterium]|nr:5-(carboxyamino)imidazole ribonucleotide mutase [Candidatus Peregrinibacteria bacterium]